MQTAIRVENLSKLYQLGQIGTGTLSRDIERWWSIKTGKGDPFVKIGQVNNRTKKIQSDMIWALKDINFEVQKGEVLGIIGQNGAGKSTLLKVLSKITAPTAGKIYVNGRIASLLEVGTGFHPEMTGRENIFMNGALLGMQNWEIRKKFDEIVDFAGVEAYIETPVKRYSSGMYVRLAFAVAAFLEPEILIVDEVLAVGDAEFQEKCLGRMKDVSVNDGRTVLFVSHNMDAVLALTKSCLHLKNGQFFSYGSSQQIVNDYLVGDHDTFLDFDKFRSSKYNRWVELKSITFKNCNTEAENSTPLAGADLEVSLEIEVFKECLLDLAVVFESMRQYPLFTTHFSDENECRKFKIGVYCFHFKVPAILRSGKYFISVALFHPSQTEFYDVLLHMPLLKLVGNAKKSEFPEINDQRWGECYLKLKWGLV